MLRVKEKGLRSLNVSHERTHDEEILSTAVTRSSFEAHQETNAETGKSFMVVVVVPTFV